MKCPNCDAVLNVSEQQGVEIDVCPQCRGVWLDRGELDKILERSERYMRDDRPPIYSDSKDGRHYPKRKSFWQEIFD